MNERSRRAQTPTREHRALVRPFELRESSSGSLTLEGYAALFDVPYSVWDFWGEYTEIVRPGAYTKTLGEQADVRLLINHEGIPIARTKSGTLELKEDDIGLHVLAPDLDPKNPTVQELASAMSRGNADARDIDQMSHMFRVIRQEWSPDYMQRDILEEELFDVSVVTFPAATSTSVGLRSRQLLDALSGMGDVSAQELVVSMRSTRQLPPAASLRSLRDALDQLTTGKRSADADEDPAALAQAIDAALDAVSDALDAGEIDQAKALLIAAEAACDALLEAFGLADPDDPEAQQANSAKLLQKFMGQRARGGLPVAILQRELDLLSAGN